MVRRAKFYSYTSNGCNLEMMDVKNVGPSVGGWGTA